MQKIQMTQSLVLLLPIPREKTEAGLIIIDDSDFPQRGIVVATDPNDKDLGFGMGDTVFYPQGNGRSMHFDGKDYIAIRSSSILFTDFPKRQVNHDFILVLIYKELQSKKREMLTDTLYAATQFIYMTRNLQFGVVQMIGKNAQENFPEMQPNDIVLFHHTIEEDAWRFIRKEPNGDELRLVNGGGSKANPEIYGIMKADGTILPDEQWIFLDPAVEQLEYKTSDKIIAYGEMSEEYLRLKVEELEINMNLMRDNLDNPEFLFKNDDPTNQQMDKAQSIYRAMQSIQDEMGEISAHLNKAKLVKAHIMFINPKTEEELAINSKSVIICDKDILIRYDIMGKRFLLLFKREAKAVIS